MTRSVIIAAARTPVAPRNGALARFTIHDLGAPVIRHLLVQTGLEAGEVDEVITGNALGAGGNPARLVALAAGLPHSVAGLSIDRQCCSGLDAILLADTMIRAGQAQVVIAGGVESYSRRPLRARTDPDGGPATPYDQPPFSPWPDRDPDMARAADTLAIGMNISREAQDNWAIASHAKALAAQDRMQAEIIALGDLSRDAFTRTLNPRLCARAPQITGTITTANTSVAADAAAFCLVTTDTIARRLALVGATILAGATLGDRPDCPGLAPVPAIKAVLTAAGLTPTDLSTAEIMEAYAAQAIACIKATGIEPAITNTGGGSLARGHPIGASGAINAVRLFHELQTRGGTGLAAIAAAGGLGTALILKT